MEEKKIFENIEIKSTITLTALFLWVVFSLVSIFFLDIDETFAFFKEVFMMIISFYLGTKVTKAEQTEEKNEGDIGK